MNNTKRKYSDAKSGMIG